MADEWRVEVQLTEEAQGLRLGGRLRALDLDDEARERLGDGVIVTRDGPRIFLYAGTERVAREAEGVARELIAADGLEGRVALTRWHPVEEAWKDADTPMPAGAAEEAAEEARHEAAEESAERYDWEVRVDLPALGDAHDLEEELRAEGLHVKRRWRHLVVGAPSEERAGDLAERIRERAPAGTELHVEPAGDIPHPLSVWVSAHTPGTARDLGIDV
jgi:hypothetical protein